MNALGRISLVVAAVMLLYNVLVVASFNEQQRRDHPYVTILSNGSNLKEGFTLGQIGFFGIVGLVLMVISSGRDRESR